MIEFTRRFDGPDLTTDQLRVKRGELEEAYSQVDEAYLEALNTAIDKIEDFHSKQLRTSWMEPDDDGSILGQIHRPLRRVGIYVPGGTAAYPSSVLMNAIPAMVAGVEEIAMVTPPDANGRLNPYTLVAAAELGLDEIYKVGGAQAIFALAYGTGLIEQVDKITGPGNIYVTLAKKLVYGEVDIDMLAGPSEILIVADETADPAYLAADLMSQAEHDVRARSILVTNSSRLMDQVEERSRPAGWPLPAHYHSRGPGAERCFYTGIQSGRGVCHCQPCCSGTPGGYGRGADTLVGSHQECGSNLPWALHPGAGR